MTTHPAVSEALAGGFGRRIAGIPIGRLATGNVEQVVVQVAVGRHDGPTVAVVLGTHGGETFVTELWRVFMKELVDDELSGTILLVSMANVTAFEAGTRHTPTDMMNVNRVFPGDPKGWHSELMAHAIASGLVPHADYVFDYHCPTDKSRACRFTYTVDTATPIGKTIHALAVASGAPVLYESDGIPGALMNYCQERGIPTFVPEIGGSPATDKSHLDVGLSELRNALTHLQMLPGLVDAPGQHVVVKTVRQVRPRNGGLFVPNVGFESLGVPLKGGTLLGTVVDPTTFEEVEQLQAPFAETMLLSARVLSRVQPGDYAYSAADLTDATHSPGLEGNTP